MDTPTPPARLDPAAPARPVAAGPVAGVDRLDLLALAVDARLSMVPSMRTAARLFAVVVDAARADGFRLDLLASGDARAIVRRVRAPRGACALAHSALGWSAPLPDPGEPFVRPSEHPQRRRAHTTTVVGGPLDDVVVWSVVRIGDDPAHLWPDGVGLIPDGLRGAWTSASSPAQPSG